MKPIQLFILAAASSGIALGAETAYTTPVGYVALDVPLNSDTNIGQPLRRPTALQALATSVASGTIESPVGVVTVSASAGLTADMFVYVPVTQPNCYYLQAVGGPLDGRYFDVVSNTTTSITIDSGTLDISSIADFKIIPFWTLGTMFPGGAGVGDTTDIEESSGLVSFKDPEATGVNRPSVRSYFHYTGAAASGTGWYDNNNTSTGLQDDLTIDPSVVARIRNAGAITSVVMSGEVPTTPVATPVLSAASSNDNYLTVQFPLDVTLAQSGLSGVLTPSEDIDEAVDIVSVYDDTAVGKNKTVIASYFYYVGAQASGTGWYINGNTAAGLQDNALGILKAGRAYNVRRSAGVAGSVQAVSSPSYAIP